MRTKFDTCEFLVRSTAAGGIDISLKGDKKVLLRLMLAVMNEMPDFATCINEVSEQFKGQGAKVIKLS
jgi:hypothetical protein